MSATHSLTVSEVEPDAAEELAVPEPVVVPDGDLEAAVGRQLVQADRLPRHRVLPLWVQRAPAHRRLLPARLAPLGQQVAAEK